MANAPTFGTTSSTTTDPDFLVAADQIMQGPVKYGSLYRRLVIDYPEPGSGLDYGLAKQIFVEHPLGNKLVNLPINLCYAQEREISGLPEMVKKQFQTTWEQNCIDRRIQNLARLARVYGVSTMVELEPGNFRIMDPLNTAGSIVGNLDPLADDFIDPNDPRIQGRTFDRTNSLVFQNGDPIYLSYTASAFGYSGKSVYYNMLGLLAQFLFSMTTDELILVKAGVIIAKLKRHTGAGNRLMLLWNKFKRNLIKEATTFNVINIEEGEEINTLDLSTLEGVFRQARTDVLDNIAAAMDAPAVLIKSEVLANGFGEGSEDSKIIANYVKRFRKEIEEIYKFLIPKVQKLAWTEEWYNSFVEDNPEWKDIKWKTALAQWSNEMEFRWPNYLTEPDSEKVKRAEAVFDKAMEIYTSFNAAVGANTRRKIAEWITELTQSEELKILFPVPLVLDFEDEDFITAEPTDLKGTERQDTESDQPIGEDDNDQLEGNRNKVDQSIEKGKVSPIRTR